MEDLLSVKKQCEDALLSCLPKLEDWTWVGKVWTPKTACVLVGIGATVAAYVCRDAIRERWGPSVHSSIVDVCSGAQQRDHRQTFKDVTVLEVMRHSNQRNHSHPMAAQQRCKANVFMRDFISRIGREQYSVSMSRSEQRNNVRGERFYYGAKDLQMNKVSHAFEDNDVLTLTDVDYYVPMHKYLDGRHVIMYTFVPECTAGPVADGVFSTTGNEVTMVMAGGAIYEHALWDYDTDHLVIDHWWGSSFYLLEQKRVDDAHRVVYLNPIRNVYGPVGWWMAGKRLYRRQLSHMGIPLIRYVRTNGESRGECMYAFSKPGQMDGVSLPADVVSSLVSRLGTSKQPHMSDAERIINTFKVFDDSPRAVFAAALFFDVYTQAPGLFDSLPPIITSCVDRHTYQSTRGLATEDGSPSMRAIWPGFSRTAFAPAKSFNNDKACLKGRIEEPRNQRYMIPGDVLFKKQEFIEHLVPKRLVHTLAPEDFEYMKEKFSKPTQRRLMEQVENTMIIDRVYVRSFQKAEAYGKITAPRNISTLPMDHNMMLGQFMYPFMQNILKETHWYAFGKHPNVTSRILQDKARGTGFAVETDANKMDGSIQEIFRDILVAVFCRAFGEHYADEIARLERKERYVTARTSHGIKYETEATILSGSIITSVLGSITNAFINYIALRYTFGPQEAWDRMGLYGGDDGVTFDLPADHLKKAAATLGMAFDAEEIPSGSPVMFLGRCFIDPWTTYQSFADVPRQMRKLHLTATPKFVADELVLHRRASGILRTDSNTPLLTSWAKNVIRLVGNVEHHKHYQFTKLDASYLSQFVLHAGPTDVDLMLTIVADKTKMTPNEILLLEARFDQAKTLQELFMVDVMPGEPEVQISAVVAGQIVHPTKVRPTIPEIVSKNRRLRVPNTRASEKTPRRVNDGARVCKFGKQCYDKRCKFNHPQ